MVYYAHKRCKNMRKAVTMIRSMRRQYSRGPRHSANNKAFRILFFTAVGLGILCIILLLRIFTGTTADTRLRDVFVEQARSEYASAAETAAQISRTGGSNTMRMLAKTRQHLYAIGELNALAEALYLTGSGTDLVPMEPIEQAIAYLEACESQLLEGRMIDEPLGGLMETMNIIYESIQALL